MYWKVEKDLTQEEEIRGLEKNNLISRNVGMRLKPIASRPPKLYGLPKSHIPLQPIVSCIGSLSDWKRH